MLLNSNLEIWTHLFIKREDIKNNSYTNRFLSTRLEFEKFNLLRKYIKSKNHLAACTPFDERSGLLRNINLII